MLMVELGPNKVKAGGKRRIKDTQREGERERVPNNFVAAKNVYTSCLYII